MSLGRFPVARTAAAKLALAAEAVALAGKLLNLVGIDKHGAARDLLRPDLATVCHQADVPLRAPVDVGCLGCAAQLPIRWEFHWHLHGPRV